MHGLLDILKEHLEVGDAVLSGGVDPLSLMIQLGTRSRFSHMAVVTEPGQLTEAYDYGLNPDESDDGVYGLTFGDYVARATTMRQLQILRPDGVDKRRVTATAAYLRDHAPGFPTLGMAFLAICGLSSPVLRRLPTDIGRRSTVRQILAAGDGVRRMHCAETATRIYHEAGLPIRFDAPRLGYHVQHLDKARADRRGAERPGGQLLPLPTTARAAQPGGWPTAGLRQAGRLATFARDGFGRTWRERTTSQDPVDLADLILPGDFMRASPFEKVARFHRDGDGWVEVTPNWVRLDGRPQERHLERAA